MLKVCFTSVVMVCVCCACLLAQEKTASSSSVETQAKAVKELVQVAKVALDFSGAVLVAKEGKVLAVEVAGTADGRRPKPIDADTLFEIASCTKSFTAIAVLQLVEKGKIKLDDSISDYLPGVPSNCKTITVRHLLQHTSGIPGTNSRGHGTRLDRVLPVFLAGGPKSKPGTKFEYWNQGYSLLSEIIAQASGKKYKVYCKNNIFKPCGMTNTMFTGDRPAKGIKVATGLSSYGKPRTAIEHPYGEYGFQYRGMGGIVTNLNDLWKWEQTLQAGKLLNEDSMKVMADSGEFEYALGWRISKADDGSLIQKHSGSVRGFVSSIQRYPDSNSCVIVLTNRDNGMPMQVVANGCERILMGESVDLGFPKPLAAETLASVDGEYQDDKQRKMVIKSSNGITSAKIFWGGPVSNGYLGIDDAGKVNFYLPKSYSPLTFQVDAPVEVALEGGKVQSLTLGGAGPELVFKKN